VCRASIYTTAKNCRHAILMMRGVGTAIVIN
jgi:hypothetical protein